MKTKKEKLKTLYRWMWIPYILIGLFTIFFGWKGAVISSILLFIPNVEVFFFSEILEHTEKAKFNTKETKIEGCVVGALCSLFAMLIGWMSKYMLWNLLIILNWFYICRFIFLMFFMAILCLIGLVYLCILWCRLNRKIAIKKLGKKRVK